MNNKYYFILSLLFVNKIDAIKPSDTLHQADAILNIANNGNWNYGVLVSSQKIIALKNPCWQLGTSVNVNGQQYMITQMHTKGEFYLLTLNRPVEGFSKQDLTKFKNLEFPDLGANSPQLVINYIPNTSNNNTVEKTVPHIESNRLIGFKKGDKLHKIDDSIKEQIVQYIQNGGTNPTGKRITSQREITLLIDEESSSGNNFAELLDTCCSLVKKFPSNKLNIILRTKWESVNVTCALNNPESETAIKEINLQPKGNPGFVVISKKDSKLNVHLEKTDISKLSTVGNSSFLLSKAAEKISPLSHKILFNPSLFTLTSPDFGGKLPVHCLHISTDSVYSIDLLDKIAQTNPLVSRVIIHQDSDNSISALDKQLKILKNILNKTTNISKASLDPYSFEKLIFDSDNPLDSFSCSVDLKYIPILRQQLDSLANLLIKTSEINKKNGVSILATLVNVKTDEYKYEYKFQREVKTYVCRELFAYVLGLKNFYSNNSLVDKKEIIRACDDILETKYCALDYKNKSNDINNSEIYLPLFDSTIPLSFSNPSTSTTSSLVPRLWNSRTLSLLWSSCNDSVPPTPAKPTLSAPTNTAQPSAKPTPSAPINTAQPSAKPAASVPTPPSVPTKLSPIPLSSIPPLTSSTKPAPMPLSSIPPLTSSTKSLGSMTTSTVSASPLQLQGVKNLLEQNHKLYLERMKKLDTEVAIHKKFHSELDNLKDLLLNKNINFDAEELVIKRDKFNENEYCLFFAQVREYIIKINKLESEDKILDALEVYKNLNNFLESKINQVICLNTNLIKGYGDLNLKHLQVKSAPQQVINSDSVLSIEGSEEEARQINAQELEVENKVKSIQAEAVRQAGLDEESVNSSDEEDEESVNSSDDEDEESVNSPDDEKEFETFVSINFNDVSPLLVGGEKSDTVLNLMKELQNEIKSCELGELISSKDVDLTSKREQIIQSLFEEKLLKQHVGVVMRMYDKLSKAEKDEETLDDINKLNELLKFIIRQLRVSQNKLTHIYNDPLINYENEKEINLFMSINFNDLNPLLIGGEKSNVILNQMQELKDEINLYENIFLKSCELEELISIQGVDLTSTREQIKQSQLEDKFLKEHIGVVVRMYNKLSKAERDEKMLNDIHKLSELLVLVIKQLKISRVELENICDDLSNKFLLLTPKIMNPSK